MATVFWDVKTLKDGSRRYYVRSKVRDIRRSHGSCRTLREAQTLKGEILKSIADGTYFEAPKKKVTFSEFADGWLDTISGTVKESTRDTYKRILDNHLIPELGDLSLSGIDKETIERYRTKKEKAYKQHKNNPDKYPKAIGPTSINRTLQVINMVLAEAQAQGLILRNPTPFAKRLKEPDSEIKILTPEEFQQLLVVLPPKFVCFYVTAIITGAREGELIGLQWGDVDFKRGYIHIQRAWTPEYGYTPPKSKRGNRFIKIGPRLLQLLSYQKALCEERTGAEDLVFPSEENTPLHRQNLLRRVHYPALERAGLERIRFHDLRHSCASLLADIGVITPAISAHLGHSRPSTTSDIYTHVFPQTAEGYAVDQEIAILGEPDQGSSKDGKVTPLIKAENGPNETS